MENLNPQQLKELYKKLPKDLQDAIFSADSGEVLRDIAKRRGLAIDKSGALADETGSVMLGLTAPREFIPNLKRRLGVDEKTAREIAVDVNDKIFAKVRESLKKIHGIGSEDGGETSGAEKEEKSKEPSKPETSGGENTEEKVPDIIKGSVRPEPVVDEPFAKGPFEAKTEGGVFRMPPEETKHEEPEKKPDRRYPEGDPYREPVK